MGWTRTIEETLLRGIDWGSCAAGLSCWLWKGATDKDGYGLIKRWKGNHRNGTRVSVGIFRAHREMLTLKTGKPVPLDKLALHTCDTPGCINPDHLFIGTAKDNVRDKIRKGRLRPPYGRLSKDPSRGLKLTGDQVKEIVSMVSSGTSRRQAAHHFGINPSTASRIVNRKRWGHIWA
jgi:hypothetical protein